MGFIDKITGKDKLKQEIADLTQRVGFAEEAADKLSDEVEIMENLLDQYEEDLGEAEQRLMLIDHVLHAKEIEEVEDPNQLKLFEETDPPDPIDVFEQFMKDMGCDFEIIELSDVDLSEPTTTAVNHE